MKEIVFFGCPVLKYVSIVSSESLKVFIAFERIGSH